MEAAVVITGASTGIGLCCAEYLAERGWRVFAGVRKDADAQRLNGLHPRIQALQLDVCSSEELQRAVAEVEAALGGQGLDGLVNNAGIVVAGPMEALPIDAFRRQMEVNVTALLATTQAFLPLLRRAKGRIVHMGSSSGRVAAPLMGAYAASKFALEGLSDAMRMELEPQGIFVSLIEPGAIQTPIWDKSRDMAEELFSGADEEQRARYGPLVEAVRKHVEKVPTMAAAPETVARAVAHALNAKKPRTRYTVGKDARVQHIAATLLPDRMRDGVIRRFLGI